MKLMHFKIEEFKCPCCGKAPMNEKFLHMLDLARTNAGIPFRITSGYRCEKHNLEVGGKPDSAHLKGCAVDIACSDSEMRFKIVSSLLQCGFKRIGEGDVFIHADTDSEKPQNVMWLYK
jgi:hypothetical protein